MPSTKYKEDGYVACPYYCKESSIEIKCVGACGPHAAQIFVTKNDKESYKYDFCCGFYWNCPQYIALDTDGK